VPGKPTKPNRLLIVVGGFFAGIFLGLLTAAVAELLDTTIRSPREIEHYKKPIIALLPEGARNS
jgi:capsular polysaccharide biosynthesis protein